MLKRCRQCIAVDIVTQVSTRAELGFGMPRMTSQKLSAVLKSALVKAAGGGEVIVFLLFKEQNPPFSNIVQIPEEIPQFVEQCCEHIVLHNLQEN